MRHVVGILRKQIGNDSVKKTFAESVETVHHYVLEKVKCLSKNILSDWVIFNYLRFAEVNIQIMQLGIQ